MADQDLVDDSLGFERAPKGTEDIEVTSAGPPSDDDDAYEDSWYQVLKAKAAGSDES
ncbi:MAG: hypothetical protein ACXWZF_04255 [Actinomycetota bacterium]